MGPRWTVGSVLAVTLALTGLHARAAEEPMLVACEGLGNEEASEIEARVRATILASQLEGVSLQLICRASSVSARVSDGKRVVTQTRPTDQASLKDTLLTCADAALAAWLTAPTPTSPSTPASTSPSTPASIDAAIGAPESAPPANQPPIPRAQPSAIAEPQSTPPDEPTSPSSDAAARLFSTRLRASVPAELWGSSLALGAEFGVELDFHAVWLAFDASVLTMLAPPEQFTPWEANLAVELGYRKASILGISPNLEFGASALLVFDEASLHVRSERFVVMPFAGFELSRRFRFGNVEVLPSVGLRVTPQARSIHVDNVRFVAIPVVSLHAGLGLSFEL